MPLSIRNDQPIPRALRRAAHWSVAAMRLVIAATALYWLMSGKLPWFVVGAVSVMLTFAPALVVRDPGLRAAVNSCVSALLCAHVVLGMAAGLYETSTV
ncbi:MAG: hypothetical protein OEM91_07140 [Hyphomicrobiales bacterium]|nr:hypothetical protein [Hyphomicrobiales bacterium]